MLLLGDCLDLLWSLPKHGADALITDLPYGTTQCRWDTVIPLDKLWPAVYHAVKPSGALVFTAAQPFTSQLINSNLRHFKYCWVWEKSKASGWLNAKRQPMRAHEEIAVFYRKQCTYRPRMVPGKPYDKGLCAKPADVYGAQKPQRVLSSDGMRYPRTVQYFKTAESEGKTYHPTQKPCALMRYLVETYTEPGETVVDPCMGSGTTGAAAVAAGRAFVGIESDLKWYEVAADRLALKTPSESG